MPVIFKNIRYNLTLQRKVKSYLLYAIGEIILVVIGILIALQVNNWNEVRKQNKERRELITALISDFKATREKIISVKAINEKSLARTNRFLANSYKNNEDMAVDSLQYYMSGAFQYAFFEPILSTYNQALSTGKIGLIQDKKFLNSVAEFFTAYNFYKQQTDIGGQLFYRGSIWELRKKIGNLGTLAGRDRSFEGKRQLIDAYELSDKEYREFIKKPEVFAAIDNMQNLFYNVEDSFQNMDTASQKIITELQKIR
ncbi:MAG: DUF6090 family protein [Gillisia sp.]